MKHILITLLMVLSVNAAFAEDPNAAIKQKEHDTQAGVAIPEKIPETGNSSGDCCDKNASFVRMTDPSNPPKLSTTPSDAEEPLIDRVPTK